MNLEKLSRAEKIKEIILKRDIQIHFQPIISLPSQEILGYEVLSYGPPGSELEKPKILFEIASEADLVWELERLCQFKALEAVENEEAEVGQFLFFNFDPVVIEKFTGRDGVLLRRMYADPSGIVFEVSGIKEVKKRGSIKQTISALQSFKDLGFRICLDNVDEWRKEYEEVLKLGCDFLKIHITLVRDVDRDNRKKERIKKIVGVCQGDKTRVGGIGVERGEEVKTLWELGVNMVQGHLYSPPTPTLVRSVTPVNL